MSATWVRARPGDDRSLDGARDRLHGLEVTRRGDRKARLDHVDAQPRKLLRDLQLLLRVQRDAGRLLAVTQRRVEDQNSVVGGAWRRLSGGVFGWHCHSSVSRSRFFSVLVSRLRAAAHALFPPRGEEKKSEIEAERHSAKKRTRPSFGMICAVRRLALIVNPVAGGGRPARALPDVQAALRATGLRAALRVHQEPRARTRAGAGSGRERRGRGGVRGRRTDRRGRRRGQAHRRRRRGAARRPRQRPLPRARDPAQARRRVRGAGLRGRPRARPRRGRRADVHGHRQLRVRLGGQPRSPTRPRGRARQPRVRATRCSGRCLAGRRPGSRSRSTAARPASSPATRSPPPTRSSSAAGCCSRRTPR